MTRLLSILDRLYYITQAIQSKSFFHYYVIVMEENQEPFHLATQRIPVLFQGRIVPGVTGEIRTIQFNGEIQLTPTRHHWRVLDFEIQRAIKNFDFVNLQSTIAPAPQQDFARYGVIIYHTVGDTDYLPEEMDLSGNNIFSDFRFWTADGEEDDRDDAPPEEQDDAESEVTSQTGNSVNSYIQQLNVLAS